MTLKAEQEHHKRAFEVYYAQGAKRSYAKVASELGISVSTTKSWSLSFSWSRRIAERDAAAARQMADRSLQSTTEELSRNKKIVTMALMKVAKAVADGKVRIQMADLDRLIRLEQLLSETGDDGRHKPGTFRSAKDVQEYLDTLSTADLEMLARAPDAKAAVTRSGSDPEPGSSPS